MHLLASLVAVVLGGCAAEDPSPTTLPTPEGLEVEVLRDIVLTENARIPENDPAYVGVEVHRDRLLFELRGDLEQPLEAGDVIVGSGGAQGYLRRATDVTRAADGRVEVATEDAVLTDLIYQGHFIVRYDPPDPAAGSTTEALGEVAGRREALDTRSGAVILVSPGVRGLRCGAAVAGDVSVDPYLDVDYVFELEVDIDGERALRMFRLELGGSVQAGVFVEGSGGWDFICEVDIVELAGVSAGVPLPTLAFSIGRVPVVITNEIAPTFTFDVDERIESSTFNYSAEAGFGLTVGVVYEDEEWSPIWESDAFADGSLHSGGRGVLAITDRVSAGIEYQARLYGRTGPSFDLETFIEASGGTGLDLCTWEMAIESGLTATFGGALEIVAGPIDWTTPEIMIGEVDLIRSPLWTGGGTFPWCDECVVGSATCRDDTGREICLGNRGVLVCADGSRVCTCSTGGAFTDCGSCIAN
jgi:hypothetical protein